jgi:hypothetical protein
MLISLRPFGVELITQASQFFNQLHVLERRDQRIAGLPHSLNGSIPDEVGGKPRLFRHFPRGLCRLTLLLLFEPELFERLTTMVPGFPRLFSGVPALLGILPSDLGSQTSVLGVLVLGLAIPTVRLALFAAVLGWRTVGRSAAVMICRHDLRPS